MREPGLDMEVLLISRPVMPTLHDGTVELVRTLAVAGAAAGWRCSVLVPTGTAAPPGVRGRPAALPGRLSSLAWRPLSMLSLAVATRPGIRHYFFTPTARVVAHLQRLHRLRPGPTVQTLCSTPADHVALAPLVFADRVVALSEHTRQRLLDEGVAPHRVVHIPPAVAPPAETSRQALRRRVRHRLGLTQETPLVLYMGDYDTAGAARAVCAALPAVLERTVAHAVLACRPKGADHRRVRDAVHGALSWRPAMRSRIHLLSTIDWSAELAAGVDVALFPARRLPDKMDLPLALLESMVAGVPAVVAASGPLADLVRASAAQGVDPENPAQLAAETVNLLRNPDHHARAAANARRWWAKEATPQILMERHWALYEDLLAAEMT